MIHVTDEKKLLEVLEHFLKKCSQHGLFLHAANWTYMALNFASADA
jgi:hypothetical protein